MSELVAMLDTNMVSDLVRSPQGAVAHRVAAAGEGALCISILVAGELEYGIRKKGSAALATRLRAVIATLQVVPFASPAEAEYGRVRDILTKAGTPIGPIDFLIAAHALALDLTLVTANIREFSRVPGLRVENWLD